MLKYSIMKKQIIYLSVILAFVIFSGVIISKHEIWRDEGRAWLIAQSAESIPELFKALKYDGTPALWYLTLYPFAKAGLPVLTMSIMHFLIIFAAVLIFLKFSPFSLLEKTLFIFGYFILYEYNAIARSYAFTVLLLFVIAAFYGQRFKKTVQYFILLSVLSASNLHSMCISIALVIFYFFESKPGTFNTKHKWAVLIFSATLLFSIYQLFPPSDLTRTLTGWKGSKASTIPNAFVSAFLPVQIPQLNFWNTKIIYYPDNVRAFWGIPLFLLSLAVFIRKPKAMALYGLTSLSILALFALKYGGSTRHHGLMFILFIFSLWIAQNYIEQPLFFGKRIGQLFSKKAINVVFLTILGLQVLAAPIPLYYDYKYDFSAGKKAADYLKENNLLSGDTFICVYDFFTSEAILPYTDVSFYSLENSKSGRFIVFNTGCDKVFDTTIKYKTDIINTVTGGKKYNKILFILNSENNDENFLKEYTLIKYFHNTIVRDESYYIYLKHG